MAFAIDFPGTSSSGNLKLPGVPAGLDIIYSLAVTSGYASSAVITPGYEYYVPYYWDGGVIDSLNTYVSFADAADPQLRLALYKSNGSDEPGVPGDLVVDAGEVSTATTGLKTANITEMYLAPGWYYAFFSIEPDAGMGVRGQQNNDYLTTPLGVDDLSAITYGRIASTYGPAPDPAPSSAGMVVFTTTAPMMALGKVS